MHCLRPTPISLADLSACIFLKVACYRRIMLKCGALLSAGVKARALNTKNGLAQAGAGLAMSD